MSLEKNSRKNCRLSTKEPRNSINNREVGVIETPTGTEDIKEAVEGTKCLIKSNRIRKTTIIEIIIRTNVIITNLSLLLLTLELLKCKTNWKRYLLNLILGWLNLVKKIQLNPNLMNKKTSIRIWPPCLRNAHPLKHFWNNTLASSMKIASKTWTNVCSFSIDYMRKN